MNTTMTSTPQAAAVSLPTGRDVDATPPRDTFSVRDVAARVAPGYYQPDADDAAALRRARAELREAYDALFHEQVAAANGGRVRATSLYVQLEEAVGNSTGGGSGAGAAANCRAPINTSALDLLTELQRAVVSIAEELRISHDRHDFDSTVELVTTEATLRRDWRLPATLAQLFRHYVERIRNLLFPVRVVEVMVPCTSCGARKTIEGTSALTCRLDGVSTVPTVRCSVCRAEWSTEDDLRALAAGALV